MREIEGTLGFKPRLPSGITRLAVNLTLHSARLRVEITADAVTYSLLDGPQLRILHNGKPIVLAEDSPVTRPIARVAPIAAPHQPAGREPRRREVTP
jgi:alpha,alpha-trehalose phosphorylase